MQKEKKQGSLRILKGFVQILGIGVILIALFYFILMLTR
jgi:hypothetical protein